MSDLHDRLAQEIWQAYVVEVGRSLPEGLADKMADTLLKVPGIAIVDRDRIDAALDRLSTQTAQCSSFDHRDRVQAQVNEIRTALLAAAETKHET